MRRPRTPWVSLCALLALVAVACGREDVELLVYIGKSPDGGLVSPGAEGGVCPVVTARACLSRGASCASASECCTGRCEANVCLDVSCAAPGASCTARSECCSGACEPNVNGGRTCLDYCRAEGEPCTRALDCCARACNGGRCGGAVCKRRNEPCGAPSECCSQRCEGGECAIETAFACRPSGEDCSSGSGSGCCGGCGQDNRCVPGPGPCGATGTACESDTDCCRGTCVANAAGNRVCTAACVTANETCARDADCCSRQCSLTESRCAPESAPACTRIDQPCTSSASCCSGACAGGVCRAACP